MKRAVDPAEAGINYIYKGKVSTVLKIVDDVWDEVISETIADC